MGSILIGDFSFLSHPRDMDVLVTNEHFMFIITELEIYHLHYVYYKYEALYDAFGISDPSGIQGVCHIT